MSRLPEVALTVTAEGWCGVGFISAAWSAGCFRADVVSTGVRLCEHVCVCARKKKNPDCCRQDVSYLTGCVESFVQQYSA